VSTRGPAGTATAAVSPLVELLQLYNDLPSAELGDGEVMIDVGDFYADEARKLLLRFKVPAMAALGVAQVATRSTPCGPRGNRLRTRCAPSPRRRPPMSHSSPSRRWSGGAAGGDDVAPVLPPDRKRGRGPSTGREAS
jgi:hypothetical protein